MFIYNPDLHSSFSTSNCVSRFGTISPHCAFFTLLVKPTKLKTYPSRLRNNASSEIVKAGRSIKCRSIKPLKKSDKTFRSKDLNKAFKTALKGAKYADLKTKLTKKTRLLLMAESGKKGKPTIVRVDVSDKKIEKNLKSVLKCLQKGDCLKDAKAKMRVSYQKFGAVKIPIAIDVNVKKFLPGFHLIKWEATLWNGTRLEVEGDSNFEETCSKKKIVMKWAERPLAQWKCYKENIFGERAACGSFKDQAIRCHDHEVACSSCWVYKTVTSFISRTVRISLKHSKIIRNSPDQSGTVRIRITSQIFPAGWFSLWLKRD